MGNPEPVGVVFRGHHERAGWCPRRRREGDRKKRGAEKTGLESALPTFPAWSRQLESHLTESSAGASGSGGAALGECFR